MAEDEDKKEEKFDFTPEGEAMDYIGLDQARVQAIEHARDNTDFYGPEYQGIRFVWEVISAEESDEYYEIRLSFRPSGRYRGEPGIEQFIKLNPGHRRQHPFQISNAPAQAPLQHRLPHRPLLQSQVSRCRHLRRRLGEEASNPV